MADLFTTTYNPDVLSCLANLSNDEVFTPPDIANAVLDLLPEEIWSDPNSTFLDPACKTGVFLREIAKRLINARMPGYAAKASAINDKKVHGEILTAGEQVYMDELQRVIDHVFSKQVYGIAITELTSYLSRRSVYCSKTADGRYSISHLDKSEGNIRYTRCSHTWVDGHCLYCGAAQTEYQRESGREAYAYEFIHIDDPKEISQMKFDVIVSNPPYQLGSNDTRATSRDRPIYNLFVEQAKKLRPRYMTMIIPSRWMATGLGLNNFRVSMLNDRHIRKLVDYPVPRDVFPTGVEIKGGVCYFLWDRDHEGKCEVTTSRNGETYGPVSRNLNEYDILVRDSRAIPILKKVLCKKEPLMTEILSADKEFGWTSNFRDFNKNPFDGGIPIYYNDHGHRLCGYIGRNHVNKSAHLIDTWKVMVPSAGSDGGQKIPDRVLGSSFIAPSPSVCTQTYLFFTANTEDEAKSINSYVQTKFLRFLVSLRKITQHASPATYTWVPQQEWDREWTDSELYSKYELTSEEIAYIDMMIKPMVGDE